MSNHNEMIPESEKHSVSVQAPTNSDSISKIVKWIAILIVAILIAPLCLFKLYFPLVHDLPIFVCHTEV